MSLSPDAVSAKSLLPTIRLVTVSIENAEFGQSSRISFGESSGISVLFSFAAGKSSLKALIMISPDTATGEYPVSVTNGENTCGGTSLAVF